MLRVLQPREVFPMFPNVSRMAITRDKKRSGGRNGNFGNSEKKVTRLDFLLRCRLLVLFYRFLQ